MNWHILNLTHHNLTANLNEKDMIAHCINFICLRYLRTDVYCLFKLGMQAPLENAVFPIHFQLDPPVVRPPEVESWLSSD